MTAWMMLQSLGELARLAWVFLKVGFMFFGGGFLLIPVLHRETVVHLHWLSPQEFVDGVAMSQLTPGPVAILATFCGLKQGGIAGAIIGTVIVFTPAFILMSLLSHGYTRVRDTLAVRSVMNGLLPAIIGLLVATAIDIGRTTVRGPIDVVVAAVALVLLYRQTVSPALLIAAGAILAIVLR